MLIRTHALLATIVLVAAFGPAAAQTPATFPDVPANTWAKVCVSDSAPDWCNLVYDPVGQQVLHWGAGANRNGPPGVHRLDYNAKAWLPAYQTKVVGGTSADGLIVQWRMKGPDEAIPQLVWDQVCYDPVRKQVIYAGPGAMFAYDPATKKWHDMKASVELYGFKHPGGPPVQWGAMCYDPVNDEIMLFPHAGVYNWDDWEKTGVVGGHLGTFVYSFKDNLWTRLKPADGQVSPPPRCTSRLAYDPKNQCIVMFGGEHLDRSLNDTWAYDCKSRTWREIKSTIVPGPRASHVLAYHPKSGKVLMAGGHKYNAPGVDGELWALDVAAGQWQLLATGQPAWRTEGGAELFRKDRGGWPCYDFAGVYDEASDLLVLRFSEVHDTYVLRPDVTKLAEAKAAAPYSQPDRMEIPPDNPEVLARLKALPANTWTPAKPARQPEDRGYTTISIDRDTGWVYYVGGGHSTYCGDDVEVYQPGADAWVQSHPPMSANGAHPFNKNCGSPAGVNFNGSWWTGHLHAYAVHDGSTYWAGPYCAPYAYGPEKIRQWVWRHTAKPDDCLHCVYGSAPPLLLYQYDWKDRQCKVRIPLNEKGELWGPQDSIVCHIGVFIGHDKGLFVMNRNRKRFGWYDAAANRFTAGDVGGATGPGSRIGEGFDYCRLPKEEAILVLGSPAKDKTKPLETWRYSIKENVWTNLNAANCPPFAAVGRLEYVPDQDAAFAITETPGMPCRQWVYSLKHNAWQELPGKKLNQYNSPMTQVVYSDKYGVLVWYSWYKTSLMRPDFSGLKWD